MNDYEDLDAGALRALLVAVTDDLLRLCASVSLGEVDADTRADTEILAGDWAWSTGANCYSDGTVIVAQDTQTHLYAPPHRRKDISDGSEPEAR